MSEEKKVSSFSDILKIWFAMRYGIPIDKKDKVKITDKKGKEIKARLNIDEE